MLSRSTEAARNRVEAIMSVITLEEAKNHLRVIGSDEDQTIFGYIRAAEAHVSKYLERPLTPWNEAGDPVPDNVKQAILLAIADFYQHREARFVGTIQTNNPAFDALLHWDRSELGL